MAKRKILSLAVRLSCRCKRVRVGRSMNKSVRLAAYAEHIDIRIYSRISREYIPRATPTISSDETEEKQRVSTYAYARAMVKK